MSSGAQKRFAFSALSHCVNILLVASLLLTVYGALWEYSTRCYLKGFSDAVVPSNATPQQKIKAILAWMGSGPARVASNPSSDFSATDRDPETTLNYGRLQRVCGTATNAFVNLADSSGLQARRLLLLGPTGTANHVVAEVLLDDRWVVVDPVFGSLLKDPAGHMLTREDLSNPIIFREATRVIPNYDANYTYEHTTHIRLAGIPLIGGSLKKALDFAYPQWEDSFDWTLLVERESYAVLVVGILLLLFSLLARSLVVSYGEKHFTDWAPLSLRAQLRRVVLAPLSEPLEDFRTDRV